MKFLHLFFTVCLFSVFAVWAKNEPETVFADDFNNKSSATKWTSCSTAEYLSDGGIENSGCIVFSGTGVCSTGIDVTRVRGRGVMVEGMMKAEALEPPRKAYLGPKLQIYFKSPYGESWIDQPKKYGSYDWQKFTVFVRIPPDAEELTLNIGLQGSTGKLFIDDLKVILIPAVSMTPKQLKLIALPLQKAPVFRGVMVSPNISEKDIKELAQKWNVNLIRYQICNFKKEDLSDLNKYFEWVQRELAAMDNVVALCRKYNIKMLIDLHSAPAKQNKLLNNNLTWTIECQDTLVKIWEVIARKYKDNPAIWGYDILNEPIEENYVYEPGGALDWNRLAERLATAIRGIDQVKPIIVEPARWGSPAGLHVFSPIPVKNIIYSIHFYEPYKFTHQGVHSRLGTTYPGVIAGKKWDKVALRQALQPVIDFQQKNKVPIYIGEFSTTRWAPGAAKWLQDVIEIFEENGWDWTYHAFREYSGWSVEHSSDPNDKTMKNTTDRKEVLLNFFKHNRS